MDYRYITSFYWAMTTVTTVGYGDISASTFGEKFFAVIGMLSGGFVFGLIVASLSDIVRKSNPGDTARSQKLGTIHAFLHERQVPAGLTRRVRAFFSTHYHQKGTVADEFNHIFRDLPENLREELALTLQYVSDDPITIAMHDHVSAFRGQGLFFIDWLAIISDCLE